MLRREYEFYVYIMASRSHQFYVGMTNNIRSRVKQHKQARPGTYTSRYNINRLVYLQHFRYVLNAIQRENELKDWNREKKIALIETNNPYAPLKTPRHGMGTAVVNGAIYVAGGGPMNGGAFQSSINEVFTL